MFRAEPGGRHSRGNPEQSQREPGVWVPLLGCGCHAPRGSEAGARGVGQGRRRLCPFQVPAAAAATALLVTHTEPFWQPEPWFVAVLTVTGALLLALGWLLCRHLRG